jgi:hypothetical protein
LIQGLYATAKKAALAAKNNAADSFNDRGKPRGGQVGNANATRRKSATNHDTNEKDVMIRFDSQGNASTYALRRLAKDRPDLHMQCLAGELTANAAMVQTGFRKPRPSHKMTPLDYLHRYWWQVQGMRLRRDS